MLAWHKINAAASKSTQRLCFIFIFFIDQISKYTFVKVIGNIRIFLNSHIYGILKSLSENLYDQRGSPV